MDEMIELLKMVDITQPITHRWLNWNGEMWDVFSLTGKHHYRGDSLLEALKILTEEN